MTRIKARSEHPAEPIFRLQGGPGISNMEFSQASRFADDHDVVLVGYRGVDGSVRLDCPEVVSALKHSTDLLGETSFRSYGDAFRACADRLMTTVSTWRVTACRSKSRTSRPRAWRSATTASISSVSVGTRTAMIYAWEHPESIHRSVMIAVNPPGHFLWDGPTIDEQIARYAKLCSQDESCSTRTGDLAATMKQTAADIPDRWFFLPIKDGNVRVASFFGLMETTSESAPLSAPMTLGSWLAAADGDASGFWFQSLLADLAFPEAFVWGQMAAVARLDARAATTTFSSGSLRPESNLGDATTAWTRGGGRLIDSWPAAVAEDDYRTVRTSDVETLLIGGEVDFAAPPQGATGSFPICRTAARSCCPASAIRRASSRTRRRGHTSSTYLASGEVDDSRYEPQRVDFTPEVTQTALGKGVGGAIVGFALLDRPLCSGWPAWCAGAAASVARPAPAPVGVPGRTRPGRLVHGRPDRRHHDAGGSARRRAARGALGRRPDRPGDLLGLGSPVPARPRPRDSRGHWPAPSSARGSGSTRRRASGAHHRDRGSDRRRNLLLIALDIARARSLRDRPAAPASSPGTFGLRGLNDALLYIDTERAARPPSRPTTESVGEWRKAGLVSPAARGIPRSTRW